MDPSILLQTIVSGVLIGGVYGLISVGLTLIFGVMRIINFAHGDLMMLAMYVTYWLFTLYRIDPFVSLIITVPAFFGVGVLIQRSLFDRVLKAPHASQLFLTVGLMLVAQNMALLFWRYDYRTVVTTYSDSAFTIGGAFIGTPRLATFVVAISFTVILYFFLSRTRTGRAMRATAQNKEISALMGVNVSRIQLIASGIGVACVGAAGSILTTFFYVSPTVGTTFTLTAFMAVVLGGMGSFGGALLGGTIIGLAESFGAMYLTMQVRELVSFVIFIMILLLRPSGLLGKVERRERSP